MDKYVDIKKLRKALYDADEITFDGLDIIDNFPAADVQPVKHGKWMYCSIEDMFHCTRCDAAAVRNTFVYCPICGARMDGKT